MEGSGLLLLMIRFERVNEKHKAGQVRATMNGQFLNGARPQENASVTIFAFFALTPLAVQVYDSMIFRIYIYKIQHTYTYTYAYTYAYTYHIHIHIHTYTYTYIYIHAYTYADTNTYIYTYTHMYMHKYT